MQQSVICLKCQGRQNLEVMLAELPQNCDVGRKRTSAKGNSMNWRGYKLHIDTAGGGRTPQLRPDLGLAA